jgi:hypothetical protein
MKILKVLPLLLVAAVGFSAAGPPGVSHNSVVAGETSLENRLKGLWTDLTLIGRARGVYLEGYGVVFTAEVTVVTAPLSLIGPQQTQAQKDLIKAAKLKRMPELKTALKQALVALATSLDVPPDENVAIALLLYRYPGEEKLPVQIVVQASKKKLLEAQGPAALDQVVHITESY